MRLKGLFFLFAYASLTAACSVYSEVVDKINKSIIADANKVIIGDGNTNAVYMSGFGSDANDGLNAPVLTIDRAYSIAKTYGIGLIKADICTYENIFILNMTNITIAGGYDNTYSQVFGFTTAKNILVSNSSGISLLNLENRWGIGYKIVDSASILLSNVINRDQDYGISIYNCENIRVLETLFMSVSNCVYAFASSGIVVSNMKDHGSDAGIILKSVNNSVFHVSASGVQNHYENYIYAEGDNNTFTLTMNGNTKHCLLKLKGNNNKLLNMDILNTSGVVMFSFFGGMSNRISGLHVNNFSGYELIVISNEVFPQIDSSSIVYCQAQNMLLLANCIGGYLSDNVFSNNFYNPACYDIFLSGASGFYAIEWNEFTDNTNTWAIYENTELNNHLLNNNGFSPYIKKYNDFINGELITAEQLNDTNNTGAMLAGDNYDL